jgi:hypothetical protein
MNNIKKYFLFISLTVLTGVLCSSTTRPVKIALIKYNGGGDWYSVVDALKNLVNFCNREANMNIDPEYATVEVGSSEIFNYPFVFLTGHGNILLNSQEIENLRNYLSAGGFLYVDDDYGLDKFIRPVFKQLFPDKELIEIPFAHPVFHQKYDFPNGMPKIHEHDDKAPKTYGIFIEGRLVCLYSTESNISDGWDSADVHKDSEEARLKALKMGANIIQFAFTQ